MAKNNDNGGVSSFLSDGGAFDAKSAGFDQKGGGTLIKLEVGQAFQGKFISRGGYDSVDSKTGEVKRVPVYLFENPTGDRAKLLGTTALDEAMSDVAAGTHVAVVRHPDITTGNKRKVHDIRVFVKAAR